MLVPKGSGTDWQMETELLPALDAPVEAGMQVGELIYRINGEETGRTTLVAAEGVEKTDLNTMLQRMLLQWI